MEKLYDRIIWHNNTSPALNETNLNLMSKGLDDIDDRVVEIAGDILVVIPQIQQYLSDADAIVERLQELTENPPYIGQNGNWYVWDTNTGAYVDSGVDASITVSIADITMIGVNENPRVTNTGTNTDPVFHLFIPAANGIARIAKTGTSGLTDTYTVTFDNGNTTTFTVVNGRGITKIEKTDTEDLVDTYTITYNDNSTSTFTVTNGKDGRNTDQVLIMPEASEDELGNIYQFTGITTANYTHGYYYECKYDSEDDLYFWDNINVGDLTVAGQDVSDAVETTITTSTATYPDFSAGETLKVIFGKIKKFLSDLKGNKTDLTNLATVESTTTASKAYSAEDWLIYNGQLYEVTAPISSGGTITIGTNVEPTTVEDGKSSGGGHTILNGSGSAMAQRGKLQFDGLNVMDDSGNDKTVVTAPTPDYVDIQYTPSASWTKGQTCISGNKRYRCKVNNTGSAYAPPNTTYWEVLSVADELSEKGTATLLLDKTYTASLRSGYNNSSFGGNASVTLADDYTNYELLEAYFYDESGRIRDSQIIRPTNVIVSAGTSSINLQFVSVDASTKAVSMKWIGYYFTNSRTVAVYVAEDSTVSITEKSFRTKLYGIK